MDLLFFTVSRTEDYYQYITLLIGEDHMKKNMSYPLVFLLTASICLTNCGFGFSEAETGTAKEGIELRVSADDAADDLKDDAGDAGSFSGDYSIAEELPLQASASSGNNGKSSSCLTPVADGVVVYQNSVASVDASHTQEGYIMAKYTGSVSKVKLQISGPNQVTYTYNLGTGYEAFPLTAGNGTYTVAVYEHVTGNSYSTALSQSFDVKIANGYSPFLYPSQYISFSAGSKSVAKAAELAASANNDLEIVTNVYNYVISNISYDNEKAATVASGYLANPDNTLATGKGICLDYAALMASMLRSQKIPTRMEVGYTGNLYHAWISVHVTGVGWLNNLIEFDGQEWQLLDPTFGSTSSEKELAQYIGNSSNYSIKYIY